MNERTMRDQQGRGGKGKEKKRKEKEKKRKLLSVHAAIP